MTILFLGEIVGKPGVHAVKAGLETLRERYKPDFIIANGDGATGGFGIGRSHAAYLHKLGINAITSGDQVYFKKDMVDSLRSGTMVLRPANLSHASPGRGWRTYNTDGGPIAVISMLGQAGPARSPANNPFTYLPELVQRVPADVSAVILDFHAITTAEKEAMCALGADLVTAVIGTGQRSLSARAYPTGGAGCGIVDAGRCGSLLSAAGLDPVREIERLMSRRPIRSAESWEGLELQGVVISVTDRHNASITNIVRLPVEAPKDA